MVWCFLLCIGLLVQHQSLFLIRKSVSFWARKSPLIFKGKTHLQITVPQLLMILELISRYTPWNWQQVRTWKWMVGSDEISFVGWLIFRCYVSFREGICYLFITTLGVTELAARNGNQLSEDAMAQVYPQWCYGLGYGKMYRCYYGNVLISGFWRGDGLKDEDHDDWYR